MLLDDLIAAGQLNAVETHLASKAVVIRAQNVADYVFNQPGWQWNGATDFPNVASPAPVVWMEWWQEYLNNQKELCGILIASYDFDDYKTKANHVDEWMSKMKETPKWICVSRIFGRSHEEFLGHIVIQWAVGPYGQTMMNGAAVSIPEDSPEGCENAAFSLMTVPWLALSFMHCKNVEIVKGPAIPNRLQKARLAKGKRPLFRWHILNIQPVKKIVDASHGHRVERLTPAALHICRGHFKDFTMHGLFGKLHGVYWWPMHVRGDAGMGYVSKDYKPVGKETK